MTARIFKSLKTNSIFKSLTMPRLGYAALVVVTATWACTGWTATEATSFQCPGGEWVVNPGTPDCPTQVESARAGDFLTDTTTNVQSDLHQTGGTGYWCIYPAANADPSWEQLVAGDDGTGGDCVDSGNGSASSATFSGSATGLTAATDYKTAQGVLRNGKRSRISVSDPFSTLGGTAPGGNDLTNSGHFVGCGVGASDSNNGLSHATRWASVTKVNNAVTAAGSNVYFQTDCVFEDQQLIVDWSGTTSDMVEIDTYCIDTSDGNKPKGWTDGGTGCGEKSEINGTWDACADANPITCVADSPSAVPTGIYSGLIELGNRSNILIQNMKVHDSAGRGIHSKDGTRVVLRNNDIDRIAFGGLHMERGSTKSVVIGNTVNKATSCEAAQDTGRLPPGWSVGNCAAGTSAQPSCVKIGTVTENNYSLVAGNLVTNCAGEGFGTASGSHIWFEQNMTDVTGLSFYLDHMKYAYYIRNLAIGLGINDRLNQSGFTAGAESSAVDRGEGTGANHQIWAFNIAVDTHLPFGMRNVGSANATAGYQTWAKFWYNTAILPASYAISLSGGGINTVTSEAEIRGTAVLTDGSEICSLGTTNATLSHNAWSSLPPSNCRTGTDVNTALTWPRTASEYENLTAATALTWTLADYKPTGANENVGPVVSVPSWATTDLASSEWDFAREWDGEGYFMWGAAGCVVNVASSALLTGADCAGLTGTPDIGAVQ